MLLFPPFFFLILYFFVCLFIPATVVATVVATVGVAGDATVVDADDGDGDGDGVAVVVAALCPNDASHSATHTCSSFIDYFSYRLRLLQSLTHTAHSTQRPSHSASGGDVPPNGKQDDRMTG